ncbi:hypothetical protein WJX73_009634 [Symbiochloris irregularis]|uniref:Uncharacterized protein n=1 Tax=Symbiochloris irregularis TaxID=706552 RepID=A0AAW1NQC7_9CHLO
MLTGSILCGVLLALCAASEARVLLPAGSKTSPQLTKGLQAYLASSPQFTLFNKAINKVNATTHYGQAENYQAVLQDQTILLVNDSDMRSGFGALASQFGISNPATFIDRLITRANASYYPPGTNYQELGTDTPASPQFESALVLLGFLNSHVIHGAYDFYGNSSILSASKTSAVNLTTTSEDNFLHSLVLQAYSQRNSSGQQSVYITGQAGAGQPDTYNNQILKDQPETISLTHLSDGVLVDPSSGLQAVNGTYQEYVWQVGGIFVGDFDLLPADAGVICTAGGVNFQGGCSNPYGALQYLALTKF